VTQQELFGASAPWPEGFAYAPDFLSASQERELLERIRALPFEQAHYQQWRARRRIVSFGYDFERNELLPAPPIPAFLWPLRARLRFRPWPPAAGGRAARAINLEPRSAYAMRGVARWGWQHAVSPSPELRYSISFRTRRS
jgi:hypothetical protein